MKPVVSFLYVAFCFALAAGCYMSAYDNLDRYLYESLIRTRKQSIEDVYRIVKHESVRAEESTILDSPEHLAQLEPMYAIRPMYVQTIALLNDFGMSPNKAISMVSAGAIFLIGVLMWRSTGSLLYSAIIMAMPATLTLGRFGTPDALSSLVVVAGCIAALRNKVFIAVLLLLTSVWIRTDNLLIAVAMLAWLAAEHKVGRLQAIVLGALALGSVVYINTLAGNYGWSVLMHFTFVGGKYPAEISTGISLSNYLHAFAANASSLISQMAVGILCAVAAWQLKSQERMFLLPVAVACGLHYALFPSGEARYLLWASLVASIIFIRALVNGSAVVPRLKDHSPYLSTALNEFNEPAERELAAAG